MQGARGVGGDANLYWLVAVGGEVLGDQTNDEATPQAGADAEEEVPVLDNAVLVLGEDAGELCWQGAQTHSQHSLHT